MRGWRRSIAIASVLLALLPAAAVAQSAGDEQYADPFGDEQGQTEQAAPTPAATQAPATGAQPAQATPAPAAAPAASNASAQAAQLPRTGWDAGVPGALGLVLMSAGVALRARVRRSP